MRSALTLPAPTDGALSVLQTIGIGPQRSLGIASPSGNLVVVDLLGYYVPAGQTATAGRFRAVPPVRVLDSRDGGGPLDGQAVTVDLSSQLPADAGAAVVTVTVVDAEREGYVTVHPAGTPPPEVSNLLVLDPPRTVSNQVVVGLQDRRFELLQTGRSHIVVDLEGSFTTAATPAGDGGLFVPLLPTQLPHGRALPGSITTVNVTPPVFGPPIGALALVADALPQEVGYVTLWGLGSQPFTTNLFLDTPGSHRAGSAVVPVAGTSFSTYVPGLTDLLLTAVGFYTA